MKCRNLVKGENDKQNIVWFGSYGTEIREVEQDGQIVQIKVAKKAPNYSEKGEAVKNSLIQRLFIIKGELWYKASYGLPLTEKIKNKGIYDSIIINIIFEHPDVTNIVSYNSIVEDRKYKLDFVAYTVYNEEIRISYII